MTRTEPYPREDDYRKMFSGAQQSPLSLLSSTSTKPLALFGTHSDKSLPDDAGIILIHDASNQIGDKSIQKTLEPYANLSGSHFVVKNPSERDIHNPSAALQCGINEYVLHVQSPNVAATWIQSPPVLHKKSRGLGLSLRLLHLQIRFLDHLPFILEVCIQDTDGRYGRLRWSTFQKQPALHLSESNSASVSRTECIDGPLLSLPLETQILGSSDDSTPWRTIAAPLAASARHLNSLVSSRTTDPSEDTALRFGQYATICYIRIHANCRLRRVWLSDDRDKQVNVLPSEFTLETG